jgi:fucose permease
LLIALAFLGFISIGLPDGLLGVAWPGMRAYFGLPIDALGGLLLMYTAGYLTASFSSGRLLTHFNVGALLALSCLATGLSLTGYALSARWWPVLLLGALAGLGAGAIDAGLNTFAATHFSARLVNWLHAFYGIGAFSGPLLITSVLEAGHAWQTGYAIVGGGQLALALCFGLTHRRWDERQDVDQAAAANAKTERATSSLSTLRLPVVWLSLAVFFIYTGIEAAAGAWAYSLFTEARGVPMMTAGTWVSVYWGALTAGRILSAMIAGSVSITLLLRCCIAGQSIGALFLWLNFSPPGSFFGLALLGLSSAPIFPSLITTTPARLGAKHTANGVGFQIAAAVLGQSASPGVVGICAGRFGLEIVGPALLLAALSLLALFEALTLLGAKAAHSADLAVGD